MTHQEQEKIIEVIHLLFDLNNKALFLAKEELFGDLKKQLAEQISNIGFQCFNKLNDLIQKQPTSEGMSVDDFVHTPLMGG